MNEQMPSMSQESESGDDLEGLSNPFDTYERLTGEKSAYFEEMTGFVRRTIVDLQSKDKLPSAPMSDSDRNNIVFALIQALDRGLCHDTDEMKEEWILKAAADIYKSAKSK